MIGLSEEAEKINNLRLMYDEKDEMVNFDPNVIKNVQQYIVDNGILTKIKLNGAKYIKENADLFL